MVRVPAGRLIKTRQSRRERLRLAGCSPTYKLRDLTPRSNQ